MATDTITLYNDINFDDISKEDILHKIDEYKDKIVILLKQTKSYEIIMDEQKQKIISLQKENNQLSNTINIQNDIIKKSRHITNTLYEKLKNK